MSTFIIIVSIFLFTLHEFDTSYFEKTTDRLIVVCFESSSVYSKHVQDKQNQTKSELGLTVRAYWIGTEIFTCKWQPMFLKRVLENVCNVQID